MDPLEAFRYVVCNLLEIVVLVLIVRYLALGGRREPIRRPFRMVLLFTVLYGFETGCMWMWLRWREDDMKGLNTESTEDWPAR